MPINVLLQVYSLAINLNVKGRGIRPLVLYETVWHEFYYVIFEPFIEFFYSVL